MRLSTLHIGNADPNLQLALSLIGADKSPIHRESARLLGRVAARECASQLLRLPANHFNISNHASGRPFISGYLELNLSISHKADRAAAAVTTSVSGVGIDLEPRVALRSLEVLYSENERKLFGDLELPVSDWELFGLCAKEAASKMHGTGFHAPLGFFEINRTNRVSAQRLEFEFLRLDRLRVQVFYTEHWVLGLALDSQILENLDESKILKALEVI